MSSIEILGPLVRETFSGKDGRAWVKYSQEAAYHNGAKYPQMFEFPSGFRASDEDAKSGPPRAYAPGFYTFDPVSEKWDPKLNRFVRDLQIPLVPASQASSK